MKITITGSLGNISKPLTQGLLRKGHAVTVISSKIERKGDIEALGAAAAIGSVEDVRFLSACLKGSDAVYTMLPPPHSMDPDFDVMAHVGKIAGNYKEALGQSGVKRVIHLSSIGAHTDTGNGILRFHHDAERILGELPSDVSITFMRPVGFFLQYAEFYPRHQSARRHRIQLR